MDENERDRQEFEQLLARFRRSLSDPASDDYFSEDDLLDIIDYAGDMQNDYLRAEALFRGARFFPDSEALNARRGLLYQDILSPEDVERYARDTAPRCDFLSALVRLSGMNDRPAEVLRNLRTLLDKAEHLDDEEIIRLVDLVEDLDRVDWLLDNINELKAKAYSPTTVLYEVGAAACDHTLQTEAIYLLEELTEREPYNAEYWSLMSSCAFDLMKYDEALEAADMALAINPDSATSAQAKGRVLCELERVDALIELYSQHPDNEVLAETLAECLTGAMQDDSELSKEAAGKYLALLHQITERFPLNSIIVARLVEVDTDISAVRMMAKHLTELHKRKEENIVRRFLSIAHQMALYGKTNATDSIMRALIQVFGTSNRDLTDVLDTMAEMALRHGRYAEALELCDEYENHNIGLSPLVATVRIMSHIASGNYHEAVRLARHYMTIQNIDILTPEDRNFMSGRLAAMGMALLVTDVVQRASESADGVTLPKGYDPLGLLI